MEVIKGNDLILSLDGVAIAAAKSCDIKIDTDAQEVANATSGQWRKYMLGRSGWNITSGGLLTSLRNARNLQRQSVSLTTWVRGNYGLPFIGIVDNVELDDGDEPATPLTPAPIMYWDKTRKKFLLYNRGQRPPRAIYYSYYEFEGSEKYSAPNNGDTFRIPADTDTGESLIYRYENGDLYPEQLTGTALVTGCQITATRGTLAQCSITLLGSGELAAATIPSATRSAETDDDTEGGEFARQHK